MAWRIDYSSEAVRQLKKIDKGQAKRIRDYMRRIETMDNPRDTGEQLIDPKFYGYWRYRVGDYRIICDIQDKELVVLIVRFGQRDKVYR
ncbi:MAG: type II toxin-antitoxin system RelE/ParE family toxin [Nitrosospira sp.]